MTADFEETLDLSACRGARSLLFHKALPLDLGDGE